MYALLPAAYHVSPIIQKQTICNQLLIAIDWQTLVAMPELGWHSMDWYTLVGMFFFFGTA